jgi:hypothetical protein
MYASFLPFGAENLKAPSAKGFQATIWTAKLCYSFETIFPKQWIDRKTSWLLRHFHLKTV